MSEMMRPLTFSQMMRWVLAEYKQQGSVFGLPKSSFYHYDTTTGVEVLGERLASPLGVAAGPHTQLAQNLLTAYLAGSRYFELKTVQQLDGPELAAYIARPCIQAQDEGYNVEWSTELTVEQAANEYIKGWLAIQALACEWGLAKERDFAFNISVGYDLPGIQSAKVDDFIENMKDAANTAAFGEGIAWLRENIGLFERLTLKDIAGFSPHISRAVTLSTLHGCPPEEIERIAGYLLTEKGLHTYVKCNPTLLGYNEARRLLDEMGYGYVSFDNHHFEQDLQYADCLLMLRRLRRLATQSGLIFGVKLTNTFPVQICRAELAGEEMYLSGRALYPLSLNVAAKLARDFDGMLSISYCGGLDAFNIARMAQTGLRPLTVATTLLKPGGYARLSQLAGEVAAGRQQPQMDTAVAGEEDYDAEEALLFSMLAKTRGIKPVSAEINVAALVELANNVTSETRYHKERRPSDSTKVGSKLPLFDCFISPCRQGGCPLSQQIPAYLSYVAAKNYAEAFRIIAIDNALPAITGVICNHPCQNTCARRNYEDALNIREAKRQAAEAAQQAFIEQLSPPPLRSAARVAVVGAGPAGVAAALFLRRNGVHVTVLEKRDKPFGMVEYVIPNFRIGAEALQNDFAMAESMGAEFRFGVEVRDVAALRKEYDFVLLATGAWRESAPVMGQGQELVLDALDFLAQAKQQNSLAELGKRVAVLGGGDVAVDCSRVALRLPGVERVSVVYRRTREFMPAQDEEIRLALMEGVTMVELAAPLSYDGRTLLCERTRMGAWEVSGRRAVIATGGQLPLHFDTVISATGARVDSDFLSSCGLELDGHGWARLNEGLESSLPNVYVVGDGKAGPATVAEAIADAKRVTVDILAKLGLSHDFVTAGMDSASEPSARGVLVGAQQGAEEAARCLHCGSFCGVCAEVCPNRANLTVVKPDYTLPAQIVHVDALCNECGNCAVFCPHQGAPYKDKFTLFATAEDFRDSTNEGWLKLGENLYRLRFDGEERDVKIADIPPAARSIIETVEQYYAYVLP